MLKKQLKISFQKDKQKLKIYVSPPTYKVEQELKSSYAVAYRKAIALGVATRSAMLELMRNEKVWGDIEEEKLLGKTLEAASAEADLKISIEQPNKDIQKAAALKLVSIRSDLYDLIQIKSLPLEHTAEAIAEDVRLDKYLSLCTFTEDGKHYFKDHEDFLNRRNDEDVVKIYNEVLTELSQSNIELIRKLPENKWLIENGLIDSDGNVKEKELINILADQST